MRNLLVLVILLGVSILAQAKPSSELVFKLKSSVVKVHVDDARGNRSVGSGVVVAKDQVVTNCHVLANGRGASVTSKGENYIPLGLKADWKHDLCILRFNGLPVKPVELGDSEKLQYGQPVFSIGFPNNARRPLDSYGKIKALYALDDSQVIRASASFRLGASGSAMLDDNGRLIGINTFKSPGRNSYFYSMPVQWIKKLLQAPETTSLKQAELPFWDAPEEQRPFFMRVVPPLQQKDWKELRRVADAWTAKEPASAEAWFYSGLARARLGEQARALEDLNRARALNPQHADTLLELGLLAAKQGERDELDRIARLLSKLDRDTADQLRQSSAASAH